MSSNMGDSMSGAGSFGGLSGGTGNFVSSGTAYTMTNRKIIDIKKVQSLLSLADHDKKIIRKLLPFLIKMSDDQEQDIVKIVLLFKDSSSDRDIYKTLNQDQSELLISILDDEIDQIFDDEEVKEIRAQAGVQESVDQKAQELHNSISNDQATAYAVVAEEQRLETERVKAYLDASKQKAKEEMAKLTDPNIGWTSSMGDLKIYLFSKYFSIKRYVKNITSRVRKRT